MQKPFLAKRKGDNFPTVTDIANVCYKPKTKVTRYMNSALGTIGIGEYDGVDKSQLWINCYGKQLEVSATHDGVKEKIRRLRPEEAAELDAIEAEMKALHDRKLEVLKRAWQKGHVVTVKELVERIKK